MTITATLRPAFRRLLYSPSRFASGNAGSAISVKHDKDGVAILTLNNPPVNILTVDTLNAYGKEMRALDENKECRGVIVTSACEKAFSAGLDINVFCSGDRNRLKAYWKAMQELWYQTYQTRLATIAAVNGPAIAGGCVLAICCDMRVMLQSGPKSLIGLNETKIGITVPFWITDRMVQLVGHHKAEHAVLRGVLVNAQDALDFGYVDRVVGSQKELMDAARQEMRQMLEVPDHARAQTKRNMRQPLLDKFVKAREQNLDVLTDVICDPRTQSLLQAYLASLTKRKNQ